MADDHQKLHADVELDARGLLCPEPLMLARKQVREMQSGQVLHILATDPSTERDFQNFCRFVGHELLASDMQQPTFEFWIKKGS
ncbi:MAG: sulfurtransferase TusA [Pseudomonadota bacterium]